MNIFSRYALIMALVGSVMFLQTPVALADWTLDGSNSFAGTAGVAIPITDLQISGSGSSPIPVKLRVTSGTLAMSTVTGLTFTGGQTGSTLYFSGTQTNINNALATLTYTRGGVGSDTLEVSLVESGEVFFEDNGHLYEYVSATLTWPNARDAAALRSKYGATGYLTTITSQQENDFVSARLSNAGWMGAGDASVEGQWRWVTGPESGTLFWQSGLGTVTYSNWNSGEPNDSGSNEDCGQFLSGGSGQWNDLPCSGTTLPGYVVEYGADGNMPEVVAKNITITTSNAPSVSVFSPVDGATNVNPASNLVITFSQTVTVDTGSILIKKTSDDSVVETIDVASGLVTGGGTTTITINPATNLADLTGYYVQIPGTAFRNGSSVYYTGIADTTTWNFTTGDYTAPTVPGTPSTTTPTNDQTPTWTWTASTDAGSGLERYLLRWSQNNDCSVGFSTTTDGTSYTIPGGLELAEGTWYFCVAARDNAQNDSVYSAAGSVVIDITPPVLTQVTPIPVTVYETSARYYFSTTESGDYFVENCGTTDDVVVTPGSNVRLTGLLSGRTYSCSFNSIDLAGNVSNSLTIGPFYVSLGGIVPVSFLGTPPQSQTNNVVAPVVSVVTTPSTPTTSIQASSGFVAPTDGFTFKINMRQGSRIPDVKRLQEFLKSMGPDIYPAGTPVTGYFGPATHRAVIRFQEKYPNEVLVPIAKTQGTGIVAQYTRNKLNSLLTTGR